MLQRPSGRCFTRLTPRQTRRECAWNTRGQWLQERLGQPVVIETRPGAGPNVATEALARAPAAGYTLGLIGLPNAINATLYDKLSFNFIRDVTPVAGILRTPEIMVVNLSVPAKTDKLPSGSQWLHEIKHDGFRIIARKDGPRVRLYSRTGNDLTRRFPLIVETLARLRSRSCIIDGEAVARGENGIASFDLIWHHRANDSVFLCLRLDDIANS